MSWRVHATAVAIEGRAVLIRGRPGAGKSDLALRLVDRGAKLVSDDATLLRRRARHMLCLSVPGFEGLLEARGLGMVRVPHVHSAPLSVIVSLGIPTERLPASPRRRLGRYAVPEIILDPARPAAPIHVEMALNGDVLPIE